MSSDNGIVSNVQVNTFDGTQKMFKPFWFYLTALLLTKDLLDVLFPGFKNEVPVSEYAKGQTKKDTENYGRNRMVMGYFGITLTSPKWMIKVENSKTEEWPSCCAYTIADELKKTFRPNDMFSKVEQKTKLCQLEYKKGKNQTLTVLVQQSEA